LTLAKAPQERARVYGSRRNFYSSRGQIENSIEQLRMLWAERENYLTPVEAHAYKLNEMCFLVWGGRSEEALDILETIERELVSPYKGVVALGYMCVYVEKEEPDRTESALADLRSYIETHGAGSLRDEACWAEGRMEEARGNYSAAIECYRRKLELEPTDVTAHREIGRCYRNLGEYEAAVASIEKMLQIFPNNPSANYELALAQRGMGNEQRAMELLQKALDLWKNADPTYEPAREARATLAGWTSESI
jgi:tetratricopeptide (TPR) repeat protein